MKKKRERVQLCFSAVDAASTDYHVLDPDRENLLQEEDSHHRRQCQGRQERGSRFRQRSHHVHCRNHSIMSKYSTAA